jgi:polysaccharide export outer membrane protein
MKLPYHLLIALTIATAAHAQTLGAAPSLLVAPPAASPASVVDPLLLATPGPLVLQPDDLVTVQVYNVQAFNVEARIGRDGYIDLPLAGRLLVGGLTIDQAQASIRTLLQQKGLVIDPGVTVVPKELPGNIISITGEVNKPGTFSALGGHTLLQLISLGEGEKDTASTVVTLIRPSLPAPVQIDLGSDPTHSAYAQLPIFAGDVIRVSSVGQVFVLGALGKQGSVPLHPYAPTTVVEAVAQCEGIGFQGRPDSARILRVSGNQRIVLEVHVGKILKGKEPDMALQNGDILYIPTDLTKAALKGGAVLPLHALA